MTRSVDHKIFLFGPSSMFLNHPPSIISVDILLKLEAIFASYCNTIIYHLNTLPFYFQTPLNPSNPSILDVGKSLIQSSLMGCRFNSDGAGVIHYSISLSRELTIGLPGVLKIAVIDPNPHDRLSAWCKQAAVILLVYDVTNLNSFEKLNNYSQECSIFRQENIPIVLVGNKIDLHEKRVISYEQGQKWAEDNSCIYFTEISALNGFNCGEMMEYLSKVTISRHLDSNEGNHRGIDISLHLAPKVLKPHVFMHIDENENGDGIEGCFDDGDCGF